MNKQSDYRTTYLTCICMKNNCQYEKLELKYCSLSYMTK